MREIKFRAWDKYRHKMRYNILPWQWDYAIETGMWKCISSGGDDGYARFEVNAVSCDGTTVMQYTGLKDKNGKEIYEGDIYRQNKNDTFSFVPVDDFVGYIKFDNGVFWCMDGEHIFNRIKWTGEVIGNVYSNPELLEANQ